MKRKKEGEGAEKGGKKERRKGGKKEEEKKLTCSFKTLPALANKTQLPTSSSPKRKRKKEKEKDNDAWVDRSEMGKVDVGGVWIGVGLSTCVCGMCRKYLGGLRNQNRPWK